MNERIGTCVINGKLCRFEVGQTVASLKRKAGVDSSDSLVRVSHATAEACRDDEDVVKGGKYRSIPPTTQGSPK